jgi:hypothetical protein
MFNENCSCNADFLIVKTVKRCQPEIVRIRTALAPCPYYILLFIIPIVFEAALFSFNCSARYSIHIIVKLIQSEERCSQIEAMDPGLCVFGCVWPYFPP